MDNLLKYTIYNYRKEYLVGSYHAHRRSKGVDKGGGGEGAGIIYIS